MKDLPTRAQLRQEIEATRAAYHELLARVPPELYSQPSNNPAWNIGDVLFHMSLAPRLLIQDVRLITKQNWLIRLIPKLIPRALFDWLNKQYTRYGARRPSRASLAQAYDEAHAITLRALDGIAEHELSIAVIYPGWDPLLSGEVTLARLFQYVHLHFVTHAREIEEYIANNEQESETTR